MFRIGAYLSCTIIDASNNNYIVSKGPDRRDDLFGYTATFAWDYPLQVLRCPVQKRPREVLVMLGLEVTDISRVGTDKKQLIFVTRTCFVYLPKNYTKDRGANWVADCKLRELYTVAQGSRNSRIRQCLARN